MRGIYILPPDQVNFSGRDELLFRAIADFDHFEALLRADEKLKLPSEFIHEEINIERWNNIPIPLIKSTETLKKCFDNTCNVLAEILRQQRLRFEAVVTHFRKVEENNIEHQASFKRRLELDRKQNLEL